MNRTSQLPRFRDSAISGGGALSISFLVEQSHNTDVRYRCVECEQIEEFQQLLIEHEQLLAEHKRLQAAPFVASEHVEHRQHIAAHVAKLATLRRRVLGAEPRREVKPLVPLGRNVTSDPIV